MYQNVTRTKLRMATTPTTAPAIMPATDFDCFVLVGSALPELAAVIESVLVVGCIDNLVVLVLCNGVRMSDPKELSSRYE